MSVGVTSRTCFNRKDTIFIHYDFPIHLFLRSAQSVSFVKGRDDDPANIKFVFYNFELRHSRCVLNHNVEMNVKNSHKHNYVWHLIASNGG